jgi:hypothetical protein
MKDKTDKVVIYSGVVIITILLITTLFVIFSNAQKTGNLNVEKLRNESLLSEKLIAEKGLNKMKTELSSVKKKNNDYEKLLSEAELKLEEKDKKISSLLKETISLNNKFKKDIDDLQNKIAEPDIEYADLKLNYERLLTEDKNLKSSLDEMRLENVAFALQLDKEQLYQSDNFLVTAIRGKNAERIVIFASRAKKLNMTFDVPQSLTESISFKIITPSGTTINPDDKSLSWFVTMDSRNFTSSLSPLTGEFEQSRQVVLNYTPKEKLLIGEYKIQIICDGTIFGNCRIRLK